MSEGSPPGTPPGTPPDESPSGPETKPETATPPAQGPASWEVVPYAQPPAAAEPARYEAPPGSTQPPGYAPPPDYGAPPGYVPPPEYPVPQGYALPPGYGEAPGYAIAPRPRRDMRPILAAIVIVVVIVVAVIGYGVVGFAFASSRLSSARSTYNAVVSHQNSITEEFNSFDSKVTAVNLTTVTAAQLKLNRTAYDQLVSQSQAAQPTLTSDDASLAAAQASLSDNSWLTVFSRSSLDQTSTKIEHERKALADAKTITGDLVQLGTFYQSFYDSLIDLDTLSTRAQASDLPGAASATATLKTDVGKALQLVGAPGLPPEMKQFLTDFQTLANDFGKFLDAVIKGDNAATQADLAVLQTDATKVDSYDFDKMSTSIRSFYQPLIDGFNSEVSKANSM